VGAIREARDVDGFVGESRERAAQVVGEVGEALRGGGELEESEGVVGAFEDEAAGGVCAFILRLRGATLRTNGGPFILRLRSATLRTSGGPFILRLHGVTLRTNGVCGDSRGRRVALSRLLAMTVGGASR
jgi:hypothetical protein